MHNVYPSTTSHKQLSKYPSSFEHVVSFNILCLGYKQLFNKPFHTNALHLENYHTAHHGTRVWEVVPSQLDLQPARPWPSRIMNSVAERTDEKDRSGLTDDKGMSRDMPQGLAITGSLVLFGSRYL